MKRARLFWLFCLIGLWTILVLAPICSAQGVSSPRQLKNDSISKLESLKTGDKKFDKEINKIVKHIQKSLEDKKGSLWVDDWHLVTATDKDKDDNDLGRGLKVFHEEKKALKRMLKHTGKIVTDDEDEEDGEDEDEDETEDETKPFIISPEVKTAFEQVIDDLILADRLLAEKALYQAKVYQGIDKGIDHQINKLEKELAKAQNELQKDRPDKAIKKYEKAWEHAQLALKLITPEIATQAANSWLFKMEEAFTTENQEQLFEVAAAIIEIGEYAIPSLVNLIQDKTKDIEFRAMCIELLSNVGDKTAIEPLINILKSEEEGELRDAAAFALGIIGNERVVNTLIESLDYENEPNARARESAAISLGVIGDERALVPLIGALEDEDKWVRTNVVRALGDLGDKRAVDPLIEVLKDEDDYVRFTAAGILGKLEDRKAIEPLLGLLQDENEDVRWNAAKALIELVEVNDTDAIPFLIEALEDEHSPVRRYAAEALVKIGVPAVDALLDKYEDERSWVRNEVAFALGEIGDDRAAEALREMLKNENKSDALNAAIALAKLGYEEGYNFALGALTDEDSFVRTDAVRALGEIGDERAVPVLIEALQDEDLFVREAAAVALNEITGEEYEYQQ